VPAQEQPNQQPKDQPQQRPKPSQFWHECKSSDVSVEVAITSASVAFSTCTEPVHTWVGLGNINDVLMSNQNKSAGDSAKLTKKRKCNHAVAQCRILKRIKDKNPIELTEAARSNVARMNEASLLLFDAESPRSKKEARLQIKKEARMQSKKEARPQLMNDARLLSMNEARLLLMDAESPQKKKEARPQVMNDTRLLSMTEARLLLMDVESLQLVNVESPQSMNVERLQSMNVERAQSINEASPLLMNAAMPLTMDVARLLSMDAAQPQTIDVGIPKSIDGYCVSVDEELMNNQPNLLMKDNDTSNPHSVPMQFHLIQKSKQRNCKDIKNVLVKTKTANFDRSCLCRVLKHEQMKKLREKGMVFIEVNTPIQKMCFLVIV